MDEKLEVRKVHCGEKDYKERCKRVSKRAVGSRTRLKDEIKHKYET